MRVGFVVDGESEIAALPQLRAKIAADAHVQMLRLVRLGTTPLAPLPKLAAECRQAAKLLQDRGADLVIVLVDRESRVDCAPSIANQLKDEIDRRHGPMRNIEVVVKDRTSENWIVADPGAISILRGVFSLEGAIAIDRAVRQSGADNVDALQLLNRAAIDRRYGKVRDSAQVLAHADIREMGRNSRSFRCLLRRLGHPDYPDDSRRPAPG